MNGNNPNIWADTSNKKDIIKNEIKHINKQQINLLINYKMNIYIGNLHFKMKEDELQKIFEEYGEVSSAKIIIDKATGRSKGFGFVEMPNNNEASNALTSLDGKDVLGRAIKVTEARERQEGDSPRKDFQKRNFGN